MQGGTFRPLEQNQPVEFEGGEGTRALRPSRLSKFTRPKPIGAAGITASPAGATVTPTFGPAFLNIVDSGFLPRNHQAVPLPR